MELRKNLPPLPERMRSLPISDKGYPVPKFVRRMPDGSWDFRLMDEAYLVKAIKFDLCWLCGQTLGTHKVFVVGPMCVVNRVSIEPPSHRECAEFAAKACPFLTLPKATRRDAGLPEETHMPGIPVLHNPGAIALYTTQRYNVEVTNTGVVLHMGPPTGVVFYAEAKLATRVQVAAAFEKSLPVLREIAIKDGGGALRLLERMYERAQRWIPEV